MIVDDIMDFYYLLSFLKMIRFLNCFLDFILSWVFYFVIMCMVKCVIVVSMINLVIV